MDILAWYDADIANRKAQLEQQKLIDDRYSVFREKELAFRQTQHIDTVARSVAAVAASNAIATANQNQANALGQAAEAQVEAARIMAASMTAAREVNPAFAALQDRQTAAIAALAAALEKLAASPKVPGVPAPSPFPGPLPAPDAEKALFTKEETVLFGFLQSIASPDPAQSAGDAMDKARNLLREFGQEFKA